MSFILSGNPGILTKRNLVPLLSKSGYSVVFKETKKQNKKSSSYLIDNLSRAFKARNSVVGVFTATTSISSHWQKPKTDQIFRALFKRRNSISSI